MRYTDQISSCSEIVTQWNEALMEPRVFSFAEEFPDYRYPKRLTGIAKFQLCREVFDEYLAHCEARLRRDDMATATVNSYRKVLNGIWRPEIGQLVFQQIR